MARRAVKKRRTLRETAAKRERVGALAGRKRVVFDIPFNKAIAAVVVVAIVAAGIYAMSGSDLAGYFISSSFQPSTSIYINQEQAALYLNYFNTSRPIYCESGRCINPMVYEMLPPYPRGMEEKIILLEAGMVRPEDIGEEYYRQPHMYPSQKRAVSLDTYRKPGGSPVICCLGSYPGRGVAPNTKPGEIGKFITFFISPAGTQHYRGAQFIPVYPDTFVSEGQTYRQNPEKVRGYFDVSITPDIMLFEPTYPQFRPGWMTKVEMTVKVKEGTPPGTYAVGISTIAPPEELNYKWQLEYGLDYTPELSGGLFSTDNPPYMSVLRVV